MSQENFIMMSAAIAQLGVEAAKKHASDGTPRDRDSLTTRAAKAWADNSAMIVEALAGDFEMEPSEELADQLADEFIQSYVAARVDTGPRGKHTPVALAWAAALAEAPSEWVPPSAKQLSHYIVAWDEAHKAFVYAASLDYHQFGQAWRFDGAAWTQVSKHAYRAGSAQQSVTGGYDPDRGGVIGWNIDGDRPYGVLVRDSGICVLRHHDDEQQDYGEDPFAELPTTGTPELENGDWSEVTAIFAHDPIHKTWVMLTATDVWELDASNRWSKRASVQPGFLPEDVDGERDHGDKGAGAVWDAKRKAVVFWFVIESSFRFFTWDGMRLAALEGSGLPDELMNQYFGVKRGSVVASHPELGVVVYAGPDLGMFALEGTTWVARPMGANAPPGSFAASLAFAPNGDALLGPGKLLPAAKPAKAEADDDADDADDDDVDDEDDSDDDSESAQAVFHARHDGVWTRMGTVTPVSRIKKLRGQSSRAMFGAAGGGLFATAPMQSLETLRFDVTGWVTLVDAEAGTRALALDDERSAPRRGLLEGPGGHLFAVAANGAVFELSADGWQARSPKSDVFGWRRDFQAVHDVAQNRIVVWGGDTTGRDSVDDTLVWKDGVWRLLPRRGRSPEYRKAGGIELELAYDAHLGRVIRFGVTEAAVLDGNRWRTVDTKAMREFVATGHRVACHDPRTRETLIVSTLTGKIARFDLAAPDLVGTIAEITEKEDDQQVYIGRDTTVFEPRSRKLFAFSDTMARVLDLGPAFDLAATLGARVTTLPDAGPDPIRLYKVGDKTIEAFYADVTADGRLRLRNGPLGGELTEAMHAWDKTATGGDLGALADERRRAGYVSADALDLGALQAALAKPVWYLDVADEPAKKGWLKSDPPSRLGGGPTGLTSDQWPKDDDGKPMGFLGQVALPAELGGGGIAVFVKTDGTATEDDDNNAAIRLTDAQLASKPASTPKGAREAKVRPITVGERQLELGKTVVERIARDDGVLGAMLEALVESDTGFSKLGGYATFIQDGPVDAEVLMQIDFDGISFDEKGWDEVGLMGGLYVFAGSANRLQASWQYT